MFAVVSTVWEPVMALLTLALVVGGAAAWLLNRLDRRFAEVHERLDDLELETGLRRPVQQERERLAS